MYQIFRPRGGLRMKTRWKAIVLSLAAFACSTAAAQQGSYSTTQAADVRGSSGFQEVVFDFPPPGATLPISVHAELEPQFGPTAGHCSPTGCDPCCESVCDCGACVACGCCESPFAHRSGLFGEFLLLRPRDTEIALAVPAQFADLGLGGRPAGVEPQGRTLILDPDYQSGYRVGGTWATSDHSSVQLTYASFESQTSNGGTVTGDDLAANRSMFPLLVHPLTFNPNLVTNVNVQGQFDVDFDVIDLDGRLLLLETDNLAINGLGGVRWANMDQTLAASYSANGGTIVEAGAQYDGLGARVGLDGEYRARNGFGAYAKGAASLMFGAARGDYRQYQQNNAANPQIFTTGKYDRLSPILDFETGVQWVSPQQRLRFSAGYMASVWFNVITTRDYIVGIQNNQFDDFSDTITFDGLTARAEVRW